MNNLASLPVPIQALSKVLLELRAEMTAAAEQQVITSAAQKEETLNVQVLVDRHTRELKVGKCFLLGLDVGCRLGPVSAMPPENMLIAHLGAHQK